MNGNKQYWNNIYESKKDKKLIYDLWLDTYKDILDKFKGNPIIDLGCGAGGNSLYLMERGYKVIACDYSEDALSIVNKYLPEIETMKIDISRTLPFKDESIEVMIADLSLHYFNKETTKNIVKEIKRVLKANGYLIGRVNSVNDINYGAGNGEKIEENFYLTQCGYKRFFNRKDIEYYFGEFEIEHCHKELIMKYGDEKRAWEFVAIKL